MPNAAGPIKVPARINLTVKSTVSLSLPVCVAMPTEFKQIDHELPERVKAAPPLLGK